MILRVLFHIWPLAPLYYGRPLIFTASLLFVLLMYIKRQKLMQEKIVLENKSPQTDDTRQRIAHIDKRIQFLQKLTFQRVAS